MVVVGSFGTERRDAVRTARVWNAPVEGGTMNGVAKVLVGRGFTPGAAEETENAVTVFSAETFTVGTFEMPLAVGRFNRTTGQFTLVQ